MRLYTHLAFGILVALVADALFSVPNRILFYSALAFGSLLPDVDLVVKAIHRTVLHSLWLVLLLTPLAFAYPLLGIPLLLGTASHLVLDSTTKKGIRLLYPFGPRLRGNIKTGSMADSLFFAITVCAGIVLAAFV